jgi:dTDP-4-amino-4,6-dideoxygalactose transaminase/nucleoside-diphosphate-sugar epimerase
MSDDLIVVGGSGFLGTAVTRRGLARGCRVVVVDRRPVPLPPHPAMTQLRVDLLTDEVALPAGRLVLLAGNSELRTRRPWELVADNVLPTARLLGALAGRDLTLVSSVEVYGTAPGPLTEASEPVLPLGDGELRSWCHDARELASAPAPPWRAMELCQRLCAADPSGRWSYALAKRAQELLVLSVVPAQRLTLLRSANLFGPGQDRVVARLTRRALAGLPLSVTDVQRSFLDVDDLAEVVVRGGDAGLLNATTGTLHLRELASLVLDELGLEAAVEVRPVGGADSAGVVDGTAFRARLGRPAEDRLERTLRAFVRRLRDDPDPGVGVAVPVVVPPRPERPDVLGDRMQAALWSGVVKSGGPWTSAVGAALRRVLALEDDRELLLTSSGTAALRLAVLAVAGPARPGDVAVVPSFTFAATVEALAQLGYRIRFCDVGRVTWTLDAACVADALAPRDVKVVVAVDALGAPADYASLNAVCRAHGVPLVADSAPSLGASWRGRPVGTQADAHAFSFSFAKVVSAAGGGGMAVVPAQAADRLRRPVDWTRSALLGEVAAAAALDLVEQLPALTERRREVAAVYAELPAVLPCVVPQRPADGDDHAWVHWVARFRGTSRRHLAAELTRRGVGTKPYYTATHRQHWQGLAEPAPPLPVTELLSREVLALPMSSELSVPDAERVFWSVVTALRRLAACRR